MRRMLLAGIIAAPTLAFAQTLPAQPDILLPDQVITATRLPQLIEKIPAGVTLLDRATIETRGYTSLPEALAAIPGLHIVQSGAMGGNASVFIRGTNSNHVLVLRDGVPVNDPADPGGLFNFGVDGLADVERIEVVRGPMSSLYGSGAIGGVINIITRHGAGEPQAFVDAAYGLPRSTRLAAGFAGATGAFDYRLHVDDRADRGFDNVPRRMSVYTGDRNGFASQSADLELGYTPRDDTRLFAAIRARTSRFALDDVGFPIYDARLYRGHDDSVLGRAGVTTRLFDDALDASLVVSQLNNDRHYIQPTEAADPNLTTGDTRYHGGRTRIANDNTWHLPDLGIAADNAILFGASHTDDTARSSLSLVSFGFPYVNSVHATDHADAGHVGAQTTLAERLTLTADGRVDSATYGGSAGTWRTGAVLALPQILSRLKASYGTAFRAPSLYDLFGVDSAGYLGNPALKPERSTGWEAGWAIDLPAFGHDKGLGFALSFFGNNIRDLIQVVYNADFTAASPQNVARASSSGYEASLSASPTGWLDITASYTHTATRNQTTGTPLLRRPREQASLNLQATPIAGLHLSAELAYVGAFQDYLYDNNGFPVGAGHAHPGTIVNAAIAYDITPKLTAYLNAYNLLDSRFEPANGYQTPGASVLAGLRAKF